MSCANQSLFRNVESIIRAVNDYIDETRDLNTDECFTTHISNLEANVIELAKTVSDYRTFKGTNTHLFKEISKDNNK